MRNDKLIKVINGIFAVIGIILLISSVIVFIYNQRFISEAEEISGIVERIEAYRNSDGDINHRVYVSYAYGGKQYDNVRVNFYSSNMYEGKEITLYCDPENPGKVIVKGSDLFAVIILAAMGIIFTCIGVIPILVSIRRKAEKNKIRNTGRALYATIDEITYNKSYTVNGRHPYVIFCNYRDDYKDIVYRFKSENLWVNPEPVLTVGSTVKVYVDENNYKKYYVDAESMIQGRIVDYTYS